MIVGLPSECRRRMAAVVGGVAVWRSSRNDEAVEQADASRTLRCDVLIVGRDNEARPRGLIDAVNQADHLIG